jgi:trimeric autotransporter adhesin
VSSTGATALNVATVSSTVNVAILTITGLTGVNRTYNGTISASTTGTPTYSGLQNGETFIVIGTPSYSFATAAVGNAKPITVAGFTAPSTNYSVTQPIELTANITTAPLTITGISISNKIYNASTTATITGTAAYNGLQNGETFSVTGAPVASFASASVNDGIEVTVSGYTAPSSNYSIAQPTGLTANITTASLSITANNILNKTYGTVLVGASGSTAFTSSGLQGGQTIGNVTIAYGTGALATAAVGTYTGSVTPSAATGGTFTASNYSITYNAGNITVTTALLTITGLVANPKTYDGTTTVSVTGTPIYTGLQNGESFTVSDVVSYAFTTASAGTNKAITRTGDYTVPSANYAITQPTLTANITVAALSITASAQSKNFGTISTTVESTSFTTSGLIGSDAVSTVTLAYSGSPTGNLATATAGTYTITPSTAVFSLGTSSNYNITYYTGTLTINATIPGTPTIGAAISSNTQATISFTAPTSNGGSPITSYTATSNPGGFTGTVNQASSGSITVTGLTNGTAYTFTVAATNNIGTGVASSASNSVTPSLYCVPTGSTTSTSYFSNFSTSGGVSNISNSTGYSTGGYADYTAQSVSQYAGNNVNFSATIVGVSGQVGVGVWVDWNNDGDFVDAGESLYNTNGSFRSTNPSNISLSVPSGQTIGNYRMRVIVDYDASTPVPCISGTVNAGEAEDYTFTVLSQTVPAVPTAVIATPSEGQASIAFTAPTNNGGSAITSYAVTATPGGATASGSSSPIIITGLTGGTAYTFTVTATNINGTSLASTPSTSVVIPLSAPVVVAATSINETEFTASWGVISGATGYKLDVHTDPLFGQGTSTVASEDFENLLTLFTKSGTGTATYSSGSSSSGDLPASIPLAASGSYSYGVTNGNVILTSNDINTTTYSSASLSFRLAALSPGGTNGLDVGDIVTVEVSPNGGSNYYSTVRVLGNSNAVWSFSGTGLATTAYDGNSSPVDFQATTAGSVNLNGYSTVSVSGLPLSSNMRIRITMLNNANSERWIIDNFTVVGVSGLGSYVSGYQNLDITGTSQSVAGLSANTTYYYRVRAVNDLSTSVNSNVITATTYKAVTTADYRTKADGNFDALANWEYNNTGSGYINATQLPLSTNNISILHATTLNQNFTIGSSKTFTLGTGGSLIINPDNNLTIAGNADFGGKPVTLLSTLATNGGAIGTITGTLINATNVTVQRYSQGQRGYRTLGHPYTTAQAVSQLTDNFQITGLTSGSLGTYGLSTGVPSALYYDGTKPVGTTSVLGRITNSASPDWAVGKGLYVFIRGNGSEGTGGSYVSSGGAPSPVTLDITNGEINQGDVTVSLTPYAEGADNYTLVGNPYPCPINLQNVTNIGSFGNVYVYNPTLSGGATTILRGGFEQQEGKNIIIPSMGCFYIQSTAITPATITFHESDKVASGTSTYSVFGTGTTTPKIGLEISTSAGFMDRTKIAFTNNATSAATDFYDGGKLGNNLVTFYSLSSERKALGIDYRKTSTADKIPLGIQTATATNYTITLSELTDLPNTQVVLKDKLLNKETILSQVGDSYSFAITADTASKGENRFEIGLLGTTVLPVQIADITAQLQTNKTVAVNWTSTAEVNLASYKVQRSKDGSNFTTVGTIAAKGASTYNYTDDLTTAGILPATIYYRLEAVDKDGSKTYSKIVAVALGSSVAKAAINIYPNPVQSTLFAQVTVTKAGAAQLKVVDVQGKIVAIQKTQLAVGTTSIAIPAAQLAAGSYVLEIETTDGKQQQRFVKE